MKIKVQNCLFHLIFTVCVSVTFSHVLQLSQCRSYDAEFSKITYGQRLIGDIFQTLSSLSLRECLTKCLYHLGCLSVNYNRDDSTCEILQNTIQRNTPDRVNISMDESGWNHFETNYNSELVKTKVSDKLFIL